MARLLITLDGVQVGEREIDKERITIGRRAHNDIVLDHIGVSGEHASVVTILNDSFLEDLGSTNGTIVNGAPARKHFLRNGDLVEIGRHRMRFVGEVAGTREAADFEKTMVLNRPLSAPRAPATGDVRTATVGAWPLQTAAASEPPPAATPVTALAESTAMFAGDHRDALAPADADVIAALPPDATAEQQVQLLAAAMPPQAPTPVMAAAPAAEPRPPAGFSSLAADLAASAAAVAPAASATETVAASASPARLQVLNGSAAGRILEISKPLTTIGRPAVQVAVISRRSDGYYLAQVDGDQPARLNGTPLVPHAVALHAHDVLEIAGVKLEFFFHA